MFTEQYTDEERENVNSIEVSNGEVSFDVPYDLDNPKVASYIDKFQWVATYKFSDRIRNTKTPNGKHYGTKGMSFRRLYILLCERYNNGDYFIDDYFEYIYPTTDIKKEADKALNNLNTLLASEYALTHQVDRERKQSYKARSQIEAIEQDLESNARKTKSGNYDMRYKRTRAMIQAMKELESVPKQYTASKRKLSDFKAFEKSAFETKGSEIAQRVRDDIIKCLATGQMPLSFTLSAKTKTIRLTRELPEEPAFYATGRFINGITLTFRLEENSGSIYRRKL